MSPAHFPSTARALYRVFIQPSLTLRPTLRPTRPSRSSLLPLMPLRGKTYMKDNIRRDLSDAFTLDEAIPSPIINLVDSSGKFQPCVSLHTTLRSLDRKDYCILQLAPAKSPLPAHTRQSSTNPDPNTLPTCKIVLKQELRQQQKAKLTAANKAKRKGGAKAAAKQLEIGWAIDANDLSHRLQRMREFLEQGRKVEIVLAPKKRARKATAEEAGVVVRKIREMVGQCKGAAEVGAEGKVLGVLTLVFQGKEVKREKEVVGVQ